ncbi:MAG TPA: trypsin-like peptidase domain-containing protein [Candidatus Limnocylindrales bacterium]|jgi:putative serine protease PepD
MTDAEDSPTTTTDPAAPPTGGRPGRGRIVLALVFVGAIGLIGGWAVSRLASNAVSSGATGSCVATDVVRTALPSVVTVETSTPQGGGNGSGQLVRGDGYVLTNYHVISSAAAAGDAGKVVVRYSDGTSSPATIVGTDPTTDLAVVKAEDGAEGRPVIAIGSSGGLVVGQPVVALGAPMGLTSTVTAGIVSALDRYVPLPLGSGQTAHLIDAVQTDASINPGNSGGALVDCAGRLVGVNSAIITVPNAAGQSGGGSVGLGFAIPVDLADAVGEQLITTGNANHPTFGLQATPIVDANGRSTALFVSVVDPGGPADGAGIQVGDVLTRVDGQPATSISQLEKLALLRNAGDSVPVTVVRGGASRDAAIVLGDPLTLG